MSNRRSFLQRAFGLGAGLIAAPSLIAEAAAVRSTTHAAPAHNVPVITTEVGDLPFDMDGDVKVFHLVAQVVKQQIAPNKSIDV